MSLQVIFRNTYVYAITIGDKRSHEFKRERGGIYGTILREEMEGRTVVIK